MKILYMDCFLGFSAAMLLGALIDAGLSAETLKQKLTDDKSDCIIDVQSTQRSSIDCKKVVLSHCEGFTTKEASVIEKHGFSSETSGAYIDAVLTAIKELDIDYVITSPLHLPDSTDGNTLDILYSRGIDVIPSEESSAPMLPADAAFLAMICNDCGPRPYMQVISVGYGAGGNSESNANILCAVIGEFNSDSALASEQEAELTSIL